MQTRPGRMGVTTHVWRRAHLNRQREMARQMNELNRLRGEEEKRLQAWIDDQDNRNLDYYNDVVRAQDLLKQSQPSELTELQNTCFDLAALNKGLNKNDATDLLERAKHHLTHKSPLAIAIGVTLVVIGLAVLIAGCGAALPFIALTGALAIFIGVVTASIGFEKTITNNASAFFNVAKAIKPSLKEKKDLMGEERPRFILGQFTPYY